MRKSPGTSSTPPAGRQRSCRPVSRTPRGTPSICPARYLVRARLFRLTDDEHVLAAVVHHIAADGWSVTPLVTDLGRAYADRCAGRVPAWTPLPVQYADYSLWQRAQFGAFDDSDSRIAAQLAYWRDALAGMPERIDLPTDRPYPLMTDQRGATMPVDWPAELQRQVARTAHEHNATMFMVVQAALLALLSKLSASSDVAVGFPIAGRRDPALDELVGFFVNTLVLRVDLERGPDRRRGLGPGAGTQSGRVRQPGRAVRSPRRATEPDAVSGAPPVDPGRAGVAEPRRPRRQFFGSRDGLGRCPGQASARGHPHRPNGCRISRWPSGGPRPVSRPVSAGRWNSAPTCSRRRDHRDVDRPVAAGADLH